MAAKSLHLRSASKCDSDARHWAEQMEVARAQIAICADWRRLHGLRRCVDECERKMREAQKAAALHRQRADVQQVSARQGMPCREE